MRSIGEMLSGIENGEIEFKQQPNVAMFKTLSAFSNKEGGFVLIGVSDSGEVTGCRCLNSDLKELSDTIVNSLGIHPSIDCMEIEGKSVIRIAVKKSLIPIAYEGRYYSRVGNTTRIMEGEDLRQFFIRDVAWDGLSSNHSPDDIDPETVRLFLGLATRSGRLSAADDLEPVHAVLTRLGLITNGKLNNAGYLLFGKRQPSYSSEYVLRVGRFRDPTIITGDRWIEGNLFQQFQEGEEAIRNFINVRYEITSAQMERQEIWDYPREAIREALVNALIHRDYFKKGQQVVVKVYDDHLWMHNPGGLPPGISVDDLKRSPHSVLRNPLMAKVFYLAGFVEQYGSGIQRMIDACTSNGLSEPVFSSDGFGFTIVIRKDSMSMDYLTGIGLHERQIRAILYVKEHKSISSGEYQKLVEVSSRTAKYELSDLMDRGVLERHGKGRATKYFLKNPNE